MVELAARTSNCTKPATVTNSHLSYACSYGIVHTADDMTDYTATNTISDNVSDDISVFPN